MREFSIAAAYAVKPDDNVTDDVFWNAENWPDEIGLRRRTDHGWTPVTWCDFAAAALQAKLPALAHAWQIDSGRFGGLPDLKARGACVTPEQVAERRRTLAHSYAQLIQYGAVYSRTVLGLANMADAAAELPVFQPTAVLSVPRVWEKAVSQAEAIKKFATLDSDFTEAGGQLTPTSKVRRGIVMRQCAAQIASLYRKPAA